MTLSGTSMRQATSIMVRLVLAITQIFFSKKLAKELRIKDHTELSINYLYSPRSITDEQIFFDARVYVAHSHHSLLLYSQGVFDDLIHTTLLCTCC